MFVTSGLVQDPCIIWILLYVNTKYTLCLDLYISPSTNPVPKTQMQLQCAYTGIFSICYVGNLRD